MRTFATVVLGIVIAGASCALFALHSVLSYVTTPSAVTLTARNVELHAYVLDAADRALVEGLRESSPELEAFVHGQVRKIFDEVLSAPWFYGAFALAYGDAVAAVEGERELTSVDLREKRSKLDAALAALGDEVKAQCTVILGPAACADERARNALVLTYLNAVSATIGEIPDEIDLEKIVRKAGKTWLDAESPWLQRARQGMRLARIGRLVALAVLFLALGLMAYVNRRPVSRMLCALGASIALSGAIYLATVHAVDGLPEKYMQMERVRERVGLDYRGGEVGVIAANAAEALAIRASRDCLHHADGIVIGAAVSGALLMLAGLVLGPGRKRARVRPAA